MAPRTGGEIKKAYCKYNKGHYRPLPQFQRHELSLKYLN